MVKDDDDRGIVAVGEDLRVTLAGPRFRSTLLLEQFLRLVDRDYDGGQAIGSRRQRRARVDCSLDLFPTSSGRSASAPDGVLAAHVGARVFARDRRERID